MFGGRKKEPEVFEKAYVEKANLRNVQVFPVPKDINNWIEINFDPNFNYQNKIYDINTNSFISDVQSENKLALLKRKKAYIERSDPLFIEWQFDKTEEAEIKWRNEVLAIKAEFPVVNKN
jgi:hypothetical protein